MQKTFTRQFAPLSNSIGVIAFIIGCSFFATAQDPGSILGGGIGGTTPEPALTENLDIMNFVGIGMTRINVYGWEYFEGNVPSPARVDNVILRCYQKGIQPMFLFEYYQAYNPAILTYDWYNIGYAFAERFAPNSAWLLSQGITDWGVTIYSAINEPDIFQGGGVIPLNDYATAMKNLADGVHASRGSLKVINGGFSKPNEQDGTAEGYGTVLAPLFNDGTLDGVDLHVYNGDSAPMTYNFSAQKIFENFKSSSGITRDINYYSTEYNTYHLTGNPHDPAVDILTATWNQLTIYGNNGVSSRKTGFAFPYTFGQTYPTVAYGLALQLNPWIGDSRGQTIQNLLTLTKGMGFEFMDFGFYQLSGSGKYLWVLQNRTGWRVGSPSTSLTVSNIPAGATQLQIIYYDGVNQTIPLTGQTSYTLTGLRTEQTVMVVATLNNIALNKPATADANISDANKGNDGNPATFWNAPDWAANHWWQVDLQAEYDITGSEILWNGSSTTGWKYKVETSTSGTTWTLVTNKTTSINGAANQNDNFNIRARYVRITHAQFDGVNWAGVKEFKVFGKLPQPPDNVAPTSPTINTAVPNSITSIDLTWSGSTDNVGVTGYDVFNGAVKVNTTPIASTNYIVTGLNPNTSYTFTVKARDAAGNLSAASNAVTAFTSPPDLIVTDIIWSPLNPAANDNVTFSAVVQNQGGTATPAGMVVSVTFYVNGNYVTYSDNSSTALGAGQSRTLTANGGGVVAGVWPAGPSGTYTIMAQTDDVNRVTESNETNNTYSENLVIGGASGGSLSGSFTTAITAVNLTSTGSKDWIHWGDASIERKSAGGSLISTYNVVGSGSTSTYNNDPRVISWSNGAPTTSSSGNMNGLYIAGQNAGYSFTLPATTALQTAHIYVGGWQSTGRLTLHLSDGSAADYTYTDGNGSGSYNNNITVSYKAASNGQTLLVTWVNTTTAGNVTLQGAALVQNASLSASCNTSNSAVDLSALGGSDWIHWGDSQLQRKSGGASQISTYTMVGSQSPTVYIDDLRQMSWSDGSPLSTSTSNRNGLWVGGQSNGFSFSLPASTTACTARIYTGGWQSTGQLTLHLSDGSMPDFTCTSGNLNGQYDNNVEVTYKSASDNQTLQVAWINTTTTGNVTIQGAFFQGNGGGGARVAVASSGAEAAMEEDGSKTFSVYPNPVEHEYALTVKYYSQYDGEIVLDLLDAVGRKVIASNHSVAKGMNSMLLTVPDVKSGIYILVLQGRGGRQIKKIMISR
ncbi:MAG: discoidin domain-containing protein [Chryseolinea sp.]